MWCKIYVLTICAIYLTHGQSVELEPFQSVFNQAEGSSLEVRCKSRNSVTWSAEPMSAMPQKAVEGATNGDNNVSTLKLTNIKKRNAGTFRCQDETTGDDATFTLIVLSVKTQHSNFSYKVDTMLQCQLTDAPGPVIYSWKKGDVNVTELPVEGKQAFKAHSNGSLEIIHPARSFAGMYTCVAEFMEGDKKAVVEVDVPYYAQPKVLPFDKSKNLVQGEQLVIMCQVLGYPMPFVSWKKGEEVIGGMESRAKLDTADAYDGHPIDNAKLTIKEVDYEDGGEYTCYAEHPWWSNFTSSQPVLVRVKDKLAALWPFLGIVAEVVILCTIIFIYEKRRNKQAMMDEQEEPEGNTEAKHADNVRHRGNANNPRA